VERRVLFSIVIVVATQEGSGGTRAVRLCNLPHRTLGTLLSMILVSEFYCQQQ
jgi:predicted transcriptional regulator